MELRAITYMFRFEDCAGTDPRTMLRACIFGQQKRLSRNYVAENLSFSSFFRGAHGRVPRMSPVELTGFIVLLTTHLVIRALGAL